MAKIKTTVSPRWAKFCGWLLRKMGWESVGGPMKEQKAIVLGVPHTSFKDFLVCYLFYTQFGKVAHIMIKKQFFWWPMGALLRALGAVPVDRKSPTETVRSLIHIMEEVPEFHLAIAPEGTRKPVKRWKSGYHLIARETGATVYLGYYDWGRKRISVGEPFELTDDVKADMQRMYDHYRPMGIQGYHKDNFIVP
ncbi:MAG: 1-acyl-sn-glycerol-3-phosphate acyltransferase [Bacteroidales bacterium]|nr:1-acyl-sn-glycerol-3-phosphate acyltransferase [Bacteroidales bacterium]MBP5676481.1 1-acyl-sn-glycerol-3-phosphate acyltransferase [Bacteroidales bacterium]